VKFEHLSNTLSLVTALFVIGSNGAAEGMEFEKYAAKAGTAIKATGAIRAGDYEKLRLLVPAATIDENGLRRIILESPGGEVVEAMRVAEVIRSNHFVTLVGGECASACAMILYPAGKYAMLLDGGKLGFHSCSDGRTSIPHPECTEAIAKFAVRNGFPYGSIKVFASLAGPADMYWISNVLAYCYGLEHFIGTQAPVTVSTLCPSVVQALVAGNFREPNRPLGPSFDCSAASSADELLLCTDKELMHLDALMGQLYRMMRKRLKNRASHLISTQRTWILDRNKQCEVKPGSVSLEESRGPARCFAEMTMDRMRHLLKENGTPTLDLSPLIGGLDLLR